MRRPPFPLAQDDEYGCSICTIANLLYMFYALDTPDVSWVNERLHRNPSDDSWSESTGLLLLDQGLSVYCIDEFDNHLFLEQGIHYVRHFYRHLWNDDWEKLHTPDIVAGAQARVHKLETEIARRNLPRYIETRKPTLDDIVRLVQAGCVVDLSVREGNDDISHAVLVYDAYSHAGENFFSTYYPSRYADETILEMTFAEFAEEWDGLWLGAWWRAP